MEVNTEMRDWLLQREQAKGQLLKSLGTKEILVKLGEAEAAYEKALRDEATFRNLNIRYLGNYGSDCAAVEEILAEVSLKAPMNQAGKPLTVEARKAWLITQRSQLPSLAGAIQRQNDVNFVIENNRITVEMAKRRLEGLRAALALKTAQIEYLKEN